LQQTTKCRTEKNVDLVNDLVLSQEDMPQTHRMVREISREIDIRLRCYEITNHAFYNIIHNKKIYNAHVLEYSSIICKKFEHLSFSR